MALFRREKGAAVCVETRPTPVEWAVVRAEANFQRYRDLGCFASDEAQRALALDARCAKAYAIRGAIQRSCGDLRGALKDVKGAHRLDPENPEFLTERGVLLCSMGKSRRALRCLDRALALDPGGVVARVERGLANWNLGRHREAIADLEAAVAQDPACVEAVQNLGALLAENGEFERALPWAERARKLDTLQSVHHFNLAQVRVGVGDDAGALALLTALLRRENLGSLGEQVRELVESIRSRSPEAEPAPWSLERALWSEFVVVPPETTVAGLLAELEKQPAFFVVLALSEGRFGIGSVYGRHGLREVLEVHADLVGPAILDFRIDCLTGIWRLCRPLGREDSAKEAFEASARSAGLNVVVHAGEVTGVLAILHTPGASAQGPGALFGPGPRFGRDGSPRGPLRRCARCDATFSYYRLVALRTGSAEDDDCYRCPECDASAMEQWLEERFRPGAWSQCGFLDDTQALSQVVEADRAKLERLGVTARDLADRLEALLEQCSEAYQAALDVHGETLLKTPYRGSTPEPGPGAPRVAQCDDLDELRARAGGRRWFAQHWWGPRVSSHGLPAEGLGVLAGDLQVFLHVYAGYQLCPWTEPVYRLNFVAPDLEARTNEVENAFIVTLVPGQSLSCNAGNTYHHADRDFLIVNRRTGERLFGSGLMPHLIGEHHFFGGESQPYRLDPERAVRVLGLR